MQSPEQPKAETASWEQLDDKGKGPAKSEWFQSRVSPQHEAYLMTLAPHFKYPIHQALWKVKTPAERMKIIDDTVCPHGLDLTLVDCDDCKPGPPTTDA